MIERNRQALEREALSQIEKDLLTALKTKFKDPSQCIEFIKTVQEVLVESGDFNAFRADLSQLAAGSDTETQAAIGYIQQAAMPYFAPYFGAREGYGLAEFPKYLQEKFYNMPGKGHAEKPVVKKSQGMRPRLGEEHPDSET